MATTRVFLISPSGRAVSYHFSSLAAFLASSACSGCISRFAKCPSPKQPCSPSLPPSSPATSASGSFPANLSPGNSNSRQSCPLSASSSSPDQPLFSIRPMLLQQRQGHVRSSHRTRPLARPPLTSQSPTARLLTNISLPSSPPCSVSSVPA